MASEIVMPRLSDSMEEGTVLAWMKSVGDEVAVGDELVEIETDKANMVYESDSAGTLVEILAEEGATLPIGEVIARLGEAGEAPAGGGPARRATPSLAAEPSASRARRPRRRTSAEAACEAGPTPRPFDAPGSVDRRRRRRAHQGLPHRPADRLRQGRRPADARAAPAPAVGSSRRTSRRRRRAPLPSRRRPPLPAPPGAASAMAAAPRPRRRPARRRSPRPPAAPPRRSS